MTWELDWWPIVFSTNWHLELWWSTPHLYDLDKSLKKYGGLSCYLAASVVDELRGKIQTLHYGLLPSQLLCVSMQSCLSCVLQSPKARSFYELHRGLRDPLINLEMTEEWERTPSLCLRLSLVNIPDAWYQSQKILKFEEILISLKWPRNVEKFLALVSPRS